MVFHEPVKTHALEMMLATLMVTCGTILLWPGETFLLPYYALMKAWISEGPGGGILVLVGVLRWRAIIQNGGYRYTPLWRIGGCCVGGGFWLTLAVALTLAFAVDEAMPGDAGPPMLLAIAVTAFTFEVFAGLRGGEDVHRQDSLHIREARSKVGTSDAGNP
ncbi:MAG TPA: hypothetical protein VHL98_11215 [Microvirga sp.]|jgi:hypothetical protein|nr:hypothetical protein [Microvirga sp.]